jgi:hypothetical protein
LAEHGAQEIARLEARCREDADALPALAEAYRRRGDAAAAERAARRAVARRPDGAEARAVLSLVLFDQGPRRELEALAAVALAAFAPAADLGAELTDGELDRAFANAEPDSDQVVDADRIAQEVLFGADPDAGELVGRPDSSFATRTMAELLARQGDTEGASRIRASLAAESAALERGWDWGQPSAGGSPARRERLETLEQWLENLRGGRT